MISLGLNLNRASKKEHVPEIDRFIQTAKERVISAQATMPLKQIYNLMIVHIFASDIFCINEFTLSTPCAGLSDTKGLGKVVPGSIVNYKKVCRLHPGEYVQAHP